MSVAAGTRLSIACGSGEWDTLKDDLAGLMAELLCDAKGIRLERKVEDGTFAYTPKAQEIYNNCFRLAETTLQAHVK